MNTLALLTSTTAFLLATSLGTSQAAAGDCADKQDVSDAGKADDKIDFETFVSKGHKTIVINKPFVVCEKAPVPSVIYVLQATSIDYQWENLKLDFLPKIRHAVNNAGF